MSNIYKKIFDYEKDIKRRKTENSSDYEENK